MTSRREEKDRRRAERLAAEQASAEQAKRRRLYSIVVGGVLALAAAAAIIAVAASGGGGSGGGDESGGVPAGKSSYEGATSPPAQGETELFAAARAAGCVLRNPPIQGRNHVPPDQRVEYNTNPPTSGNHDAVPAGDGAYSESPTSQDLRHFLHTLEHGRVEIFYDPGLDRRRINQLGGLFNDDPFHMVLMPYRRMPYKAAATAWGHVMGCNKVSDRTFDALRAFRDRYRDQGPEQVP